MEKGIYVRLLQFVVFDTHGTSLLDKDSTSV